MKASIRPLLLQALAAMAWADGDLDPKQRTFLSQRFEEIPKDLLDRCLSGSVSLPKHEDLLQSMPSLDERLEFVGQLIQMSSTDGRLAPQEARLLGSLGPEFGMTEEVLNELIRSAR